MEEPEQRGGGRASDDRSKQPRAEAIPGEAVTVVDGSRKPAEREIGAVGVKGCSQLLPPERAPPTIVVAANDREADTGPPNTGERFERGEGGARDHGTVLEPELEEVAVDHQVVGDARYVIEKAVKCFLDFGWGEADVGIGDDEGDGRHARSIDAGPRHRQPPR